jgi:hypothetical protein
MAKFLKSRRRETAPLWSIQLGLDGGTYKERGQRRQAKDSARFAYDFGRFWADFRCLSGISAALLAGSQGQYHRFDLLGSDETVTHSCA